MHITQITIVNFKSIKEKIEINCSDKINAFVGKNGTGKSAVFDAINFILGESYPMPQSFQKSWFNSKDKKSLILIKFNDNKSIKFEVEIDTANNIKGGLNFMKGEERNKYKINYLGADRTIKSIMPTNGFSLLGKYFYNPSFFNDDIALFNTKMQEAMDILLKNSQFVEFQNKVVQEFSSQIDRKDIKANFTLYDKNHCLKGLEFVNENGVNLIDEGSGIQNSFIIACLRALAIHKGTENNAIFIDEPELYLHPHAKKSLYNTLQKLAENGIQIFYITHSTEFVSYTKSNEIYRFYIDIDSKGTQCKSGQVVPQISNKDNDISKNKIDFNDAFFADIIFIVEGYTDYLFLEYVVLNKTEKRLEELNISIIETGKSKIDKYYSMYSNLGIDCFILYDKDTKKAINKPNKYSNNETVNSTLNKLNGYGFDEDLEGFLGYDVDKKNKEEKTDKIKKWIHKEIGKLHQDKIDKIWKIITEKISSLSPSPQNIIEIY